MKGRHIAEPEIRRVGHCPMGNLISGTEVLAGAATDFTPRPTNHIMVLRMVTFQEAHRVIRGN
jgi:hypothetical protein